MKEYKKLIRRWDSKRELSLRQHARTTKYNRLVHKFRRRSTRLRVTVTCWNAGLPKSVKQRNLTVITPFKVIQGYRFW